MQLTAPLCSYLEVLKILEGGERHYMVCEVMIMLFERLLWGVRQAVKPLDFRSSIRRFESCTPCQNQMVDVAQLVERESVALVGAGSSPVIHPKVCGVIAQLV